MLAPVGLRAQLELTQTDDEIVVMSRAAPTWKIVLSVRRAANVQQPGGGTVRALHIPATNPESLVGTVPAQFGNSGWGLDNLEWRYVPDPATKRGVRSPLGTTASIDALEILKNTPTAIVIQLSGKWQNVPWFVRTLEFNSHGCRARVEADWAGPTGYHSMWWLMSLFRSSRIDHAAVKIHDTDTEPVALPIVSGKVAPLPEGIDFPYEVAIPLAVRCAH